MLVCDDVDAAADMVPTRVGRPSAEPDLSGVSLKPWANSGDHAAARWRRHVVRSLQKPWSRQQQQPSWDSVHTVELTGHHTHCTETQTYCICRRWWWAMQGWVLAISVGVMCFCSYALIEVCVGALSSIRFGFCTSRPFRPEDECEEDAWISWGGGIFDFGANVSIGTAMAAASAWLVFRFAPAASGSGIPEVKTLLNGFVMPDVFTMRTLSIKVPALVLAVASGMALGHEGPMVHVAVCWAHMLTQFSAHFQNADRSRELVSAAVAAGVSSAFGTPVGGVLFSLEEVSSHFPSKTLLRAFIASVVATLLLSVSNLTGTGHLTMFSVTYTVTFHPSEYVVFAILGIAGGLVGAMFNALNIRWNTFRMKPAYRKHVKPVHEVMVIAFLTLISSWPLAVTRPLNPRSIHALFDTCNPVTDETMHSRLQVKLGLCNPDGSYTAPTSRLLVSLGAAALIRFLQTAFTIGTVCPAGLFVPSLFVGACLGRVMGATVKLANAGHRFFQHTIDPGVYSMVGAAAVLGGVCRMTISLVVIMLELTGGLDYVVPFMISVLLARAVGDALNESIYDLYIVLKGYPFLHEELDVTFTERCCDIMQTQLTKLDVASRPRPADLRELLRKHTYRGFPVVDGAHFVSYVRRRPLEDMLQQLESKGSVEEPVTLATILPHADANAMRMGPETPLSQVHQVFKQLGCQHIFVVGSVGSGTHDALLGMLSKKNFLRFLKDGEVGHMPARAVSSGDSAEFQSARRATTAGENSPLFAPHIRASEIFSVLDAARMASFSTRPYTSTECGSSSGGQRDGMFDGPEWSPEDRGNISISSGDEDAAERA